MSSNRQSFDDNKGIIIPPASLLFRDDAGDICHNFVIRHVFDSAGATLSLPAAYRHFIAASHLSATLTQRIKSHHSENVGGMMSGKKDK